MPGKPGAISKPGKRDDDNINYTILLSTNEPIVTSKHWMKLVTLLWDNSVRYIFHYFIRFIGTFTSFFIILQCLGALYFAKKARIDY